MMRQAKVVSISDRPCEDVVGGGILLQNEWPPRLSDQTKGIPTSIIE